MRMSARFGWIIVIIFAALIETDIVFANSRLAPRVSVVWPAVAAALLLTWLTIRARSARTGARPYLWFAGCAIGFTLRYAAIARGWREPVFTLITAGGGLISLLVGLGELGRTNRSPHPNGPEGAA